LSIAKATSLIRSLQAQLVFLDSPPESGQASNPTLCDDARGVDRDSIHAKTIALDVESFNSTLK